MLITAPLRRPNGRRDGSWDLVDLQIFAMSAGIFVFWVFIKILDYQVVVLVFGFWVLEGLMVCSFFFGVVLEMLFSYVFLCPCISLVYCKVSFAFHYYCCYNCCCYHYYFYCRLLSIISKDIFFEWGTLVCDRNC